MYEYIKYIKFNRLDKFYKRLEVVLFVMVDFKSISYFEYDIIFILESDQL